MKRMAGERAWLVKIHFVNHQVELAVKEAILTLNSRQYTILTQLWKNKRYHPRGM